MIIAIPIKTSSHDAALAPLFGNAKFFAFASDDSHIDVVKMEQDGGRDVARTLIANNVDVLITSHLGFNPYVLLKSYGIKVYFAGDSRMTVTEAIKAFYANQLVEVSAENFETLLGDHNHNDEDHHHHHHSGDFCSHHAHG